MSNDHTVRKGMTPGWAIAWILFIGGVVLFTKPSGDFQLSSGDAANILLNTLQIIISLLR